MAKGLERKRVSPAHVSPELTGRTRAIPRDLKSAREFKFGRVYTNKSSGELLRIIGEVETTTYGTALIGEFSSGEIGPIGIGEGHAENYSEVPLSAWYARWASWNPTDEELQTKLANALADEEQARKAGPDDFDWTGGSGDDEEEGLDDPSSTVGC